jgi:nuclear pore complex protein Nup155
MAVLTLCARPLGQQQLGVRDELLEGIQTTLHALKDFLDQNPQLFHSTPGDHAGARSAAASEQDAWRVRFPALSKLAGH